jgi:hypothetical protein
VLFKPFKEKLKMTSSNKASATPLDRLRILEATFVVKHSKFDGGKPEASPEGRVGPYLAGGDGKVEGPNVNGTASWTLFENQEFDLKRPANMVGVIETEDGARIEFETIGIFIKPEEGDRLWRQSAAVRFSTSDSRYDWLNAILAFWSGAFDSGTYVHHYDVYAQVVDKT